MDLRAMSLVRAICCKENTLGKIGDYPFLSYLELGHIKLRGGSKQ